MMHDPAVEGYSRAGPGPLTAAALCSGLQDAALPLDRVEPELAPIITCWAGARTDGAL